MNAPVRTTDTIARAVSAMAEAIMSRVEPSDGPDAVFIIAAEEGESLAREVERIVLGRRRKILSIDQKECLIEMNER